MSTPPLLLIVDDEPFNVELLIDILEDENYRVFNAQNGEECLALYTERKPDLILLDVMMPVLDGYGTCQRLRELEKDDETQTPVIFLSAKANLDDKLKGYAAGGDDYVTKPFDNSELLAKVESTLQKYRQIEELKNSSRQANAMTFQMMTQASKMGAIGRFLQDSLACKEINQLLECFFQLATFFELSCTLKIRWHEDLLILSHDGIERPLDIEIIKSYVGHDKIFRFGKNRALFCWGDATLLVRNVNDEADNIAIMMDGLLAGHRAIVTHDLLVRSVDSFRHRNHDLIVRSARELDDLHEELRVLFNEFGPGTTLNAYEEEAIAAIVDRRRRHLDAIVKESLRVEELLAQTLAPFR